MPNWRRLLDLLPWNAGKHRTAGMGTSSESESRSPTAGRILDFKGQSITALPSAAAADISIDLEDCKNLVALPDGLRTGTLNLSGCTALQGLPSGLDVAFLDLAGCTALQTLPNDLRLRGGRLNLKGCAMLSELPAALGTVAQLDLSVRLPQHLCDT